MSSVTFAGSMVQVDAQIVADGLRLTPEALRLALQGGTVTSRCEAGVGDDAGRYRVTFFSASRRMRLVVGADGTVLQRSSADYSRRSVP